MAMQMMMAAKAVIEIRTVQMHCTRVQTQLGRRDFESEKVLCRTNCIIRCGYTASD